MKHLIKNFHTMNIQNSLVLFNFLIFLLKLLEKEVNKNLKAYFYQTYKRIEYEEFLSTQDYYIQKINFFMEEIQNIKQNDLKYGNFLCYFIYSIEKAIILSDEEKILKNSISMYLFKF